MCGGIGEPEEHPAIHWERIAGFKVDNKLWAKGSVEAILEFGYESAPDELLEQIKDRQIANGEDVKPVCFLGGLPTECADTTGCHNPDCARLGRERAAFEVAPDGESRPPTPSSRVATEYPDGNFPQLWSKNYLKRLIREEIQEAFAQRVREQNAAWVRTREGED